MAVNFDPGNVQLISLVGNRLLGIGPERIDIQNVCLDKPIRTWKINRAGDDYYQFSIDGYPYVGIANGKVVASTHSEKLESWHFTYREYANAYTIEPVNARDYAWAVAGDWPNADIGIERIDPNSEYQLFRFHFVD